MLVLEFVWKPMEEIGNAVLVLRGVAAGINHCLSFQKFSTGQLVRENKNDLYQMRSVGA